MKQKANQLPLAITTNMDILVASFGGVGTSFFMHFLKKHRQINCPHDMDGLKHTPIPPLTITPNLKAVYIFGDPIEATVSLFRRGYHQAHLTKLAKARNSTDQNFPKNITIEGYAENLEDWFRFEEHYQNWRNIETPYPILFIKYQAIWDKIDTIFEFLELPSELKSEFPVQKARQSKIDTLSKSTRENLEKLYGDFSEQVSQLPEIEIKPKKPFSYMGQLPWIPYSMLVNKQKFYPKLIYNSFVRNK